ncbi:MAG: hypothetical protein IKH57_02230 [Clostridia bacterium]|nr:hypothetical protein [Clostridia bacterium]
MKKRFLAIIMAMMLIFGTMPAVFAEAPAVTEAPAETEEEASLGDMLFSLFGEGGALNGLLDEGGVVDKLVNGEDGLVQYLPEGIDASGILSGLREQLADKDSELYRAANNLQAFVTNEDGSLNMDKVKMLASSLFAGGEGAGEEAEEEIGAQAQDAIREYIKKKNADTLEAGDAQVVILNVAQPLVQEDGTAKVIGYYTQQNYVLDGKDYKFLCSATDMMVVTIAKNADGLWEAVSHVAAEDGEGYAASVAALCESVGFTTDDLAGATAFGTLSEQAELYTLMDAHPEVERIEYNGEMVTGAQLKEMLNDAINALMAQMGGGAAE